VEKLKESTVLQGRYTIKRILGEGGYGIVYLAYDNQNKVDCAIKEFSPSRIEVYKEGPQGTQPVELSESQKQKYYNDSLDNFKREIQILKKLKKRLLWRGETNFKPLFSNTPKKDLIK